MFRKYLKCYNRFEYTGQYIVDCFPKQILPIEIELFLKIA